MQLAEEDLQTNLFVYHVRIMWDSPLLFPHTVTVVGGQARLRSYSRRYTGEPSCSGTQGPPTDRLATV